MKTGSRSTIVLAVLAASLVGAAVGTIGFGFIWFRDGLDLGTAAGFAATGLWWGFWPALVACSVLGLPIHNVILRKTRAPLFLYAASGATSAAVVSLIFAKSSAWWAILIMAGTLAACAFWLVRRPDRPADSGLERIGPTLGKVR